MAKRTWSKEEKLSILKEAETEGVQVTLRKHGVYPGSYYAWKSKYEQNGDVDLDDQARRRKDQQYIRKLEDEVGLLKLLLADKEMELALKDDLLKKKYPLARKKS